MATANKKTKIFPKAKTVSKQDWALRGLKKLEAESLFGHYGPNTVAVGRRVNAIVKLLRYFKNPMIIILLFAAGLSGIFGDLRSAVIIIVMALASVFLNFYQEHKSGKEAEKLQDRLSLTATVLRDGVEQEIDIKRVVPGDTCVLSAGDIVPADGEVIRSEDLFVNESSLTGESLPVEKVPAGDRGRAEKQNSVFAGTNIISGSAVVKISATGRNTAYGKIAANIEAPQVPDAFEKGISVFGLLIVRATLFIVLSVFIIITFKPVLEGHPITQVALIESILFAIAIAVGLTPELLPVIMSVNMAKGSARMAKKGVLVKRLNAIPDFGSMDILCTDKTGTLTEDRITLVRHVSVFGKDSEKVLHLAYLNSSFQTGLKNPLDAAILAFSQPTDAGFLKIDEIPYDFQRKRISVVVAKARERKLVSKGQPEEILKICSHYLQEGKISRLTAAVTAKSRAVYEDYSRMGYKVLAVAFQKVGSDKDVYSIADENNLILAGFICFFDPPKSSAAQTLVQMRNYGVEIKIITGDNELVTEKICRELKLPITGVMTGDQLASFDDAALAVQALKISVFARFSPEQKNRVIRALRSQNKVVGYLGDGINDAPSLKTADVGISVSNGVDVARETADIILTRKSLRVLTDGIMEGRKTFGNTMKYLMMGVSSNFGNMFSMIAAAVYLPFLPMRPIQVLLNNTLYDISQITLPSDKVDPEYLKKPKHWNINFIKKFMLVFGSISSVFDVLTFILLFQVFHLASPQFQTGWFIESLATQTLVIYIVRTKRLAFRSRPSPYLVGSTLVVLAAATLLITTPLGHYFGFEILPKYVLVTIFLLTVFYLLIVEICKHWFYKKYDL